jgi:hypothetical protein
MLLLPPVRLGPPCRRPILIATPLPQSLTWCTSLLRNVPEGRCDRSQARSAWESATPKEPSRRVRCDSRRCAHRFDDYFWPTRQFLSMANTFWCLKTRRRFRREIPLGLAAPDQTVPYGTVLSRDAFPGTSCQATIGVVPTGRCPFGFGAKICRGDLFAIASS